MEELIDRLEGALVAMRRSMEAGKDITPLSDEIVSIAERLAQASPDEAAPFKERYQKAMIEANAIAVGCFWRSTVTADLLQNLGLELSVYDQRGLLKMEPPEGVSVVV